MYEMLGAMRSTKDKYRLTAKLLYFETWNKINPQDAEARAGDTVGWARGHDRALLPI